MASTQPDDGADTLTLPHPQGRGASVIAAHLRAAILGGTYTVGDRLPPERDIARALGASRTTIRNALRLLEDDDLVIRKAGSGTYVTQRRQVQQDDIAEITSPLELVEVRSMIEPQVVRLAVRNGRPRDLDFLWQAVVETERAGTDVDQFSRCDQRFHLALAETAHNPLFIWIFHQMNRIRSHRHWVAVQYKVLTPARIAAYNAQHRALADAISVRDSDTAVDVIQRHLQSARSDLLGVQD